MKSVEEVLSGYFGRGDLIAALEAIQKEFGYLSSDHMRVVEQKLGVPLVDIHGVATFYSAFRLTPAGRHKIKLCMGTACHVKGSNTLKTYLEEKLKIKEGQVTEDGRFSLEYVNCIGACAKAPAMMIDGQVFGQLNQKKIEEVLEGFE
ncbi:MAG: NADH-quinone oxidoreductase subunit NuoE [Candidatus Altiarchaeales archaeon]|nr:NADH-quinone oxidoreductase subunit NuoE [Candidatus Altiarchaeales archaeon]